MSCPVGVTPGGDDPRAVGVSRRSVLGGALALLGAAAVAPLTACSAGPAPAVPTSAAPGSGLTAAERALHPAVRRPRPAGVVALLRADGPPAAVLDGLRELDRRRDTGALIGVGAAGYDAAGIDRPAGLTVMPEFVGDLLLPDRTNPAAMAQVEADDPETAARLAGELVAGLPGLAVAWRTVVTREPLGERAGRELQRNPFGFVEGQANPAVPGDTTGHGSAAGAESAAQPATVADHVLLPDGASLLALRVIRLAHVLWDADELHKQERIIGRRADGRWLDGSAATGEPGFAADPDGAVTPLDAHVRAVNPRTADAPPPRMLRRSWTYSADRAAGGVPDEGMVFMAFQNDLDAGFVRAQQRLRGDALAPYLLTVGGGYFVTPGPAGLTW